MQVTQQSSWSFGKFKDINSFSCVHVPHSPFKLQPPPSLWLLRGRAEMFNFLSKTSIQMIFSLALCLCRATQTVENCPWTRVQIFHWVTVSQIALRPGWHVDIGPINAWKFWPRSIYWTPTMIVCVCLCVFAERVNVCVQTQIPYVRDFHSLRFPQSTEGLDMMSLNTPLRRPGVRVCVCVCVRQTQWEKRGVLLRLSTQWVYFRCYGPNLRVHFV